MDIYRNFIAGEWVASGDTIENVNPSNTRDMIGAYAQATARQLDDAVEAARRAQPVWAAFGLEARSEILDRVGRELMTRSEELGTQLSREEGKPLAEGKGEVYRAGQFFTYYAAQVFRTMGDLAPSVRQGIEVAVTREPVGVVGVISPWNFPMATACWKIAPALAYGNAVVWKPANLTPASAWALAEIFSRQSLPAGVFNLVMGTGETIGNRLAGHPHVNAISFTGSVEIGQRVAAAAIGNLTRLQMEMGSKNPLLVMEDADLDLAATVAANGAFGGTGQKCTASSRLIVHSKVHDAFVEKLAARARGIKVGDALDPQTQMGPAVSASQLRSNLLYVELAKSSGCELVTGGSAVERDTPGHFMEPTVFSRTTNDMVVNQEEMFGPITCVIEVADFDEAVNVANDTRFGLTAGIMTRSLACASEFRARSRSGCVMVNVPTAGTDYHVPFGGTKMSSYGSREQGTYAAEFYTTVKTAYIHAGRPA